MTCEGCNDSGCCCSPLSQFANSRVAGLHPEHVVHDTFVLTASEPSVSGTWGTLYQLLTPSIHLVGVSAFADPGNVATSSDLKGIAVLLYEASDPDDEETYVIHHGITLQPGESYTFGDEILGSWFDTGLYAQVIGNSGAVGSGTNDDRVILNVSYVERDNYSPSFTDQNLQLQHYWACNRTEDFKENWYGGSSNEDWANTGNSNPGSATVDKLTGPRWGQIDGVTMGDSLVTQAGDSLQDENLDAISIE